MSAILPRAILPRAISPRTKLLVVGLLGAAGAVRVGYVTANNQTVALADVAALLRIGIIAALLLGGLSVYASRGHRAMGRVLIIAGLFSCVWFLNGSHEDPDLTVGLVASSFAPWLFCCLILAFPSWRIGSGPEQRFIIVTAAVMALAWLLAVLVHRGPISDAELWRGSRSGLDIFFLGRPDADKLLAWVVCADWLIISAGTALLVIRRARRANHYSQLLLTPVAAVVVTQLALLAAFIHADALDAPSTAFIRTAYVATAAALPAAIFLGLAMQRLSLGRVLARFIVTLGTASAYDVQSAMAHTLNDPALKIFYPREDSTGFVDAHGARVPRTKRDGRRRTSVQSGGRTLAVVDFDAGLSDQEEYIKATGKTAALWLEQQRLASDLAVSKRNLETSRARLATTANEERRRIQRDLHDGAQQHLIGMHMKLALALEAIEEDPARCGVLLAEIGDEMGETASDLRSLAADVFPPTLREHGLLDALKSAVRRMGIDVRLQACGLSRHPDEIETQMYFVCLEALQNVSKHGGSDVTATLRLWEVKRTLYLELRDTGTGFDPERVETGSGLSNMRARLDSIHGRLTVASSNGGGTAIRAVVPIRRSDEEQPEVYSTEGSETLCDARSI
ncbi:MAG: sensor histidine kinase [Solirubrobacteraceae bacterium]